MDADGFQVLELREPSLGRAGSTNAGQKRQSADSKIHRLYLIFPNTCGELVEPLEPVYRRSAPHRHV